MMEKTPELDTRLQALEGEGHPLRTALWVNPSDLSRSSTLEDTRTTSTEGS